MTPTALVRLPSRAAACVVTALTAMLLAGACTGSPTAQPGRTTPGASSSTGTTGTTTSSPTSSTATTPAPTSKPRPRSCGVQLAGRLTAAERAGQLLMVGLQPTGSQDALAARIRAQHLGAVIYLGGWSGGRSAVAAASQRLQRAAGGTLLIAADQEGGEVQQLRGPGFSRIPSARVQATLGPAVEERAVRTWSEQLRRAGVLVNLAPVADTVPRSLGTANAPIGRYQRDFAPGDPGKNAVYVAAFVRGSRAAGVPSTLKHFPGLGRVTGNTDTTTSGITDTTAGPHDPYLEPFRAGIAAGAPLVMVSSARYPRLDPHNPAMFSRAIVSGLLRHDLGFTGVVINDDVGAAKAVSAVPVGQRATRFIAAGGDIVLTADASQSGTMLAAIAAMRAHSPAFAAQVDAAAARVLGLKATLGLLRCP